MTKRIQRVRTKGWRAPEGTLNITRPGGHGNPFPVINGGVHQSLYKFQKYLNDMEQKENAKYLALLQEVSQAKFVMCWCRLDRPCHGDIWIERARKFEVI